MSVVRKIGFVGVGNMGNPMAGRLVKKGFDVVVYDIRPETAAAFVAQHGGRAAASLADVAHGADLVITMLPSDGIVREAVLGNGSENCVLAGLARGALVMDMSTSNPSATRSLAAALAAREIGMVDAPVMGGVVFAKDGTLDIMVGGDAALTARVSPVLQALGRSIIRCGGIGAAHAMKALANYINACALINAVEALTIGKRFGLDARLMAQALVPMCAGRNHPIEKKVIPHVLTRRFGTGMAMAFIAKDVKIAVDTAHAVGAFAPLGERVAELWADAAAKLGGDLDQTQIARYWEEASDVKLE